MTSVRASLSISIVGLIPGVSPRDRITVKATRPARLMFLSGAALEGPRYLWWNFVSSRKERIEQAKEEWTRRLRQFGAGRPVAEKGGHAISAAAAPPRCRSAGAESSRPRRRHAG
jgi:hypothetical protein